MLLKRGSDLSELQNSIFLDKKIHNCCFVDALAPYSSQAVP